MNYLARPRIYFGGTWTVNVATGNNHPYVYFEDEKDPDKKKQLLLDFANSNVLPVSINGTPPSDAELRQYMAIEQAAQPKDPDLGNWNYYGSNTASFATSVVAVDVGDGPTAADSLVGQPAAFQRTALCDANPTGSQSTQMFCDAFQLGGVKLPQGSGQTPKRTFSRWVGPRNIDPNVKGPAAFSGYFDTLIPLGPADWKALAVAGSPALSELCRAAKARRAVGLNVRYVIYLTQLVTPLPTDPQAYRLKAGPVTGVIGLIGPDELFTYPVSRRLRGSSITLKGNAFALGPAMLAVDTARKTISIDFATALPDDGPQGDKVDLGTLALELVDASSKVTPVASIPYSVYNKSAFDRCSGIVDVSYAANAAKVKAALATGNFRIATDKIIEPLYSEVDALETDDRNVYLQQREDGEIRLLVTRRGRPLAGARVYLQQADITDGDTWGAAPEPKPKWLAGMPASVVTGPDGYAMVPLHGRRAGQCAIRFSLVKLGDTPYDTLNDSVANVRILPTEDYSTISDHELLGEAGFQLIYDKVLRFFYLAYPIMQGILDFSNYHVMTSQVALSMLPTVTDPAKWWEYGYMPRSRDLSASRYKLLVRWCRVNLKALYG